MSTKDHNPFYPRWRLVLIAACLFIIAGISAASAQLSSMNRAVGAAAELESTGEECATGLAIDVSPFGMICSKFCDEDSECTEIANAGCRQVYQDGSGERVGICFPRRAVANP